MTDEPNNPQAHTPGPWQADFHNEQRDGGRFITYVRGGNDLVPIAAVPTGVEGYGREEGRANARLIEAAPDLLEAVERARRQAMNIGITDGSYLAQLDAAIARTKAPHHD